MRRFTLLSLALGLVLTFSATSPVTAIPALGGQELTQQESLAIGVLRSIASAEATHAAKYGRPGTLAELVEKQHLGQRIKDGAVLDGYRLGEVSVDATNQTWEFKAEPVNETQGKHAFNIVNDYKSRYRVGLVAPAGKTGKVFGAE